MALFTKPDPAKAPPAADGGTPTTPGAPGPQAGGSPEPPAPPATSSPARPPVKPIPGLAVRAIPASGFCRAGRRWTPEVQVVALSEFTKAQVKALREEPNLVVEDVEIAPEPEA